MQESSVVRHKFLLSSLLRLRRFSHSRPALLPLFLVIRFFWLPPLDCALAPGVGSWLSSLACWWAGPSIGAPTARVITH